MELYSRNFAGTDTGDVFQNITESTDYYYLLLRTESNNGDYDVQNNLTKNANMFYLKFEKQLLLIPYKINCWC